MSIQKKMPIATKNRPVIAVWRMGKMPQQETIVKKDLIMMTKMLEVTKLKSLIVRKLLS